MHFPWQAYLIWLYHIVLRNGLNWFRFRTLSSPVTVYHMHRDIPPTHSSYTVMSATLQSSASLCFLASIHALEQIIWLKDSNTEWTLLCSALDHEAIIGQDLYGRSGSSGLLINTVREACDLSGLSRVSKPLGSVGEVTGFGKYLECRKQAGRSAAAVGWCFALCFLSLISTPRLYNCQVIEQWILDLSVMDPEKLDLYTLACSFTSFKFLCTQVHPLVLQFSKHAFRN